MNDLGSFQIREAEFLRQIADLKRKVSELEKELHPHRDREKMLHDHYEAIVSRLRPAVGVSPAPSVLGLGADLGFDVREFLLVLFRLEDAGLIHADYDYAKLNEIADTITLKKP